MSARRSARSKASRWTRTVVVGLGPRIALNPGTDAPVTIWAWARIGPQRTATAAGPKTISANPVNSFITSNQADGTQAFTGSPPTAGAPATAQRRPSVARAVSSSVAYPSSTATNVGRP